MLARHARYTVVAAAGIPAGQLLGMLKKRASSG
jgi:hypothetical protein